MKNVIEFPTKNRPDELPNYAGHILMLDLKKARKWQCFNFWLGIKTKVGVVPEEASMDRIHEAVQTGVLIDITDHPELFEAEKPIADVTETETGKKIYSGTRKFFYELGLDVDYYVPGKDVLDETVAYATDSPEEQKTIEAALAAVPLAQPDPISLEEARSRATRTKIVIPPGMDNPERYLLFGNPQ